MAVQPTEAAKVCIAVTTVLGVVAIAIVALRFYSRLRIQKVKLGADDWCILVALLLSTGIAILTDYVAATTGVGDSSFEPTLDQVIFALKTNLGLENAQVMCMGLIKISFLLYYQRIFEISRTFKTVTNLLIGAVASFEFSIIMAVLLSKGTPISTQWDPFVPFKLNISAIVIAFCAGNAVLDLITLVLPITVVGRLQMSANKKMVVSVIFSLGSFCIVASLVRLYYAFEYTKVPATGSSFFQAPFIYNILWALIEPPVFIVTGSLLTLGPLFRSEYGPASLFRSLRSALLSIRRTSQGTEHSRTSKTKDPALYGNLPGGSQHNLWLSSKANSTTEDDTAIPAWELRDLNETVEEGKQRRAQGVV